MQNHPTSPSPTRNFARARVSGRALWQALLGAIMGIGLTAALMPHYLVLHRLARDTAGFHDLQATLTAPVPEAPANGFPEVPWLAP